MKFGHKKQNARKGEGQYTQYNPPRQRSRRKGTGIKAEATPMEDYMDHLKLIAQETTEEFEILTQASNAMLEGEMHFKEDEKQDRENVADQADVLIEAQNAIDNGAFEAQGPKEKHELQEEEPFAAKKEDQLLLDQARDIVEAVNVLDMASLKENHHLRHLDRDLKEPGEYNPASVIDEKIKEEQKEQSEEALKDELVQAL